MYRRDSAYGGRSLAFASFTRDHTELNEFYWSIASATHAVAGVVRRLASPVDYQYQLKLPKSKFERPLPHSVEEYSRTLKIGDQWQCRVTASALGSMFEKYLQAAASAAVASDPLMHGSFPLLLDGFSPPRRGLDSPAIDLSGLTKGEWSSRLATFRKLFGSVPAKLTNEESKPEILRKKRNKIAHGFAADSGVPSTTHGAILAGLGHQQICPTRVTVSEKELISWFAAVYRAAKAIDAHLCARHIGAFEPAAIYLEWERNPKSYEKSLGVAVWKPGR